MQAEREIPVGAGRLAATIAAPERPLGVVVFAHGSGSSRFSPRNRAVARRLNEPSGPNSPSGHCTVLLDLLTEAEEDEDRRTAGLRFDVGLLGERLVGVLDWARAEPGLAGLPIGLFGASTGAAAALIAAAARPDLVASVVSRGGRPDLAEPVLDGVRAPTLLLVGGSDREVLALNRRAAAVLGPLAQVRVIGGAGHLFEEPGALEQVAEAAREWFDAMARRDQHTGSDHSPSRR